MRNAPAFSVHWHYQGKPSRAYLYILCAPPLLTPCKARGVQMERDRITTSTVRRNPLLSESDRRGFSPDITNAPPTSTPCGGRGAVGKGGGTGIHPRTSIGLGCRWSATGQRIPSGGAGNQRQESDVWTSPPTHPSHPPTHPMTHPHPSPAQVSLVKF